MRRPQKADIMPWLAHAVSSERTRALRRSVYRIKAGVRREANFVQVFINPRDPFGLPLLQALMSLQDRFEVRFQLHTVWQFEEAMFPEPELWQQWALQDACQISRLYDLKPPERPAPPSEAEFVCAAVSLLDAEKLQDPLPTAVKIMADLWRPDNHSGPTGEFLKQHKKMLADNEETLRRLGHYQGSMTCYLGEWFWGVDRLDHLERSLTRQGLNRKTADTVTFTRTWADLGSAAYKLPSDHPAAEHPLEVFFSIRSPYSYLGLERAVELANAWNISLQLRPILPMVMRGQSVPDAKKWYIVHDTKREAGKLGLPYGFIADPLGAGVERCYALFEYARSLGREIEYMRSYARAVNAEGIRSETDAGLKFIVERAGLDWQKAKTLLADDSWRDWAEQNRQAMYRCGLWGVPSFRYGDTSCWGQDRLWIIDNEIRKKVEQKEGTCA